MRGLDDRGDLAPRRLRSRRTPIIRVRDVGRQEVEIRLAVDEHRLRAIRCAHPARGGIAVVIVEE